MGRRYEASEWVEFLTEPGTPRAATKRLAKKFSDKVNRKFDAWSTAREGYVLPVDEDMLAYKTFASIVGHGVGLWDGDLFPEKTGRAFEGEVMADIGLVGLGHDVDGLISMDSEESARRRKNPRTAAGGKAKQIKALAAETVGTPPRAYSRDMGYKLRILEAYADFGPPQDVPKAVRKPKGSPFYDTVWPFLTVPLTDVVNWSKEDFGEVVSQALVSVPRPTTTEIAALVADQETRIARFKDRESMGRVRRETRTSMKRLAAILRAKEENFTGAKMLDYAEPEIGKFPFFFVNGEPVAIGEYLLTKYPHAFTRTHGNPVLKKPNMLTAEDRAALDIAGEDTLLYAFAFRKLGANKDTWSTMPFEPYEYAGWAAADWEKALSKLSR